MRDETQTREAVQKAYAQTELLLSSIPSILIGVGQDGLIGHWNAVAETAFGIPASQVMNQPFSECPVRWDFTKVMAGIEECRRKGSPLRLDDIRFQRPNGQDGFLGFTLIPLREGSEGPVECLLFGADITERRRIEQLKNDFVSTVSHELRSPLTIIKEGVSQVSEGILGKINREQRHYLAIALEAAERLRRIVDDLLDISKIESGRFELRRTSLDLVALVKEVISTYHQQVKRKGLAVKTSFPAEPLEAYVDRGRMIQVFTNLIDNALKFTEKGEIGLSVVDQGSAIECSVWDTGKGIPSPDLPKVFGQFQQFGPMAGPGQKGTGLGLAITKGIVESHQGSISVESRFGKGTRFTFSLPKYTAKEWFRDCVGRSIKEALRQEAVLSILVFDIENYESLLKKKGPVKTAALINNLEGVIAQNLRRKADVSIKNTRAILVLLPATHKEEALIVAGRIQQTFDDYLSKQSLENEVKFSCRVTTYPEDGSSEEELLQRVWGG